MNFNFVNKRVVIPHRIDTHHAYLKIEENVF